MRVGGTRQLVTGGSFKVLPAMLAKALAATRPTIAEDAIHSIGADDLVVDLRHKVEIHGPQRTGDPQFRIRPVPALVALSIDSDPIRVSVVQRLMRRVRIGASYDIHAELAAAAH